MMTVPNPSILTDSVTGFESQNIAFGEKFTADYEPMHTTGTQGQGFAVFKAYIVATLEEDVNFLKGTFYNP